MRAIICASWPAPDVMRLKPRPRAFRGLLDQFDDAGVEGHRLEARQSFDRDRHALGGGAARESRPAPPPPPAGAASSGSRRSTVKTAREGMTLMAFGSKRIVPTVATVGVSEALAAVRRKVMTRAAA